MNRQTQPAVFTVGCSSALINGTGAESNDTSAGLEEENQLHPLVAIWCKCNMLQLSLQPYFLGQMLRLVKCE